MGTLQLPILVGERRQQQLEPWRHHAELGHSVRALAGSAELLPARSGKSAWSRESD